MDELATCHLPATDYLEAYALQERLRDARQADRIGDTLLLLEHPPVLTRTRRTTAADLPMGDAFYREHGIDIVDVDRGGKLTYHAPGQLVGYAIMRTASAKAFVQTMERALVAALADEGLDARSRCDDGAEFAGIWVEDRKIASVGIHVQRGVTTHGFAINASNDLDPFGWVVACGLPSVQMTSLALETGRDGAILPCLRKRAAFRFAEAFGLRQRLVTPAALQRTLALEPAPT